MSGDGDQRIMDVNSPTVCHAAFRYVIDGVGQGDTLPAGSHTIALQANLLGGGNCYLCAEADGTLSERDTCQLNVIAVPQ